MKSLTLFQKSILIFSVLLWFASPTTSQPEFSAFQCLYYNGNYTTNSTYKANLHKLFATILSNTEIDYGFYNLSVGDDMDTVNGIALCRGDVRTHDCRTCIHDAKTRINLDCPNQKSAIGWYPKCMIWYSNEKIFKGLSTDTVFYDFSSQIVSNPKSYNHTVSTLMMQLAHKVASGDSRLKFSTGEVNVTRKLRIYALLQCIPDMQEFDCLNCLRILVNFTLASCCYGREGVRVAVPSCSIWFENHKFYESAIVLPPPQSPPPSLSPPFNLVTNKTGKKGQRSEVAMIVTIPIVICALLVLIVLLACKSRHRRKLVENFEDDKPDELKLAKSLQLDFGTIKAATDNFSDANKLGRGGFGAVYKGILPSGQLIAVKRLSKTSNQGDKEFKNESLLVAKLQHRNLVRFFGFCLAKEERLLIYEYLANRSLDKFLFDPVKCKYLNWENRYNIIEGIARGLLYLHEESRLLVVHRDLKASNVLLDTGMKPKISDFGMARLFGADQSHANTSKIAGTYGYMPPEYLYHGQFSIKSDIFSFGVLVLEIISGQKANKFSQTQIGENLLTFAWGIWSEENALRLVDPNISTMNTDEVLRCIHIALLCVQENPTQRPIMSSVVLMLNSYSITLSVPSKPAFLVLNDMNLNPELESNDKRPLDVSINEMTLSTLDPR